MATQTAASEHSTLPDQHVKEEVQDEVKPVEDKPSELLTSEEVKKADVIAEPEEIIQEKKEPDVEEIPTVKNSISAVPLGEPEEKIQDKAIEPSPIEQPTLTNEEKIEDKNIVSPVIEEPKIADKDAKTEAVVAEEEIPVSFPASEEKSEEHFEKDVAVVEPKDSVNLETLLKENDESTKDEPIKIETADDVPKQDENAEKSPLTDSISAPLVAEKSLEVENISRDVELVAENDKEVIKEQIVAAETKESVEEEPKKTEAKENGEETLVTEESKETEDLPKEEVKTKSLISKVKSSFVKAKKAIIGKSPNPKATVTPPETKDEVKF